jgi:hypothetical protein
MNLNECLNKLAYGKISNLAFCQNGEIKPEYIPKLVDAVNEALIRIYTVLPIREQNVMVELQESRTEYPLTSEHSVRNNPAGEVSDYYYYIRDTEENPFTDDILTILEVWDDLEQRRPLNDPDDPLTVYTPAPNVISVDYTKVNDPLEVRTLNVIYRARHKRLAQDDFTVEIKLPDSLIGALLSYTAYLIHSDMNTENALANAQKYLAEYQSIISEVQMQSVLNQDKPVLDQKFIRRGFV